MRNPVVPGRKMAEIVARSRSAAEDIHRRAYLHVVKKRNGVLFWHTNAPMRGRITRQITSVHSICLVKTNEVTHRRGNKLSARRHFHVGVGISDDSVATAIDNLSIQRREMSLLLLDNVEETGLSQMTVTTTRNGTR
jgi:hypothetical protein